MLAIFRRIFQTHLTCPTRVCASISAIRKGRAALYELWAHNLWLPTVTPKIATDDKNSAEKKVVYYISALES